LIGSARGAKVGGAAGLTADAPDISGRSTTLSYRGTRLIGSARGAKVGGAAGLTADAPDISGRSTT